MHRKNSQNPVYRYYFAKPRPEMIVKGVQAALAGGVVKVDPNAPKQAAPKGAVHSADIEYFMGNLSTNLTYGWTPDDHKTSKDMQEYLANFIKTGNPNGGKLTNWPAAGQEAQPELIILDANPRVVKGTKDARYELLDSIILKK
jgi:para-nitrobenzyl esterase